MLARHVSVDVALVVSHVDRFMMSSLDRSAAPDVCVSSGLNPGYSSGIMFG